MCEHNHHHYHHYNHLQANHNLNDDLKLNYHQQHIWLKIMEIFFFCYKNYMKSKLKLDPKDRKFRKSRIYQPEKNAHNR